MIDAIAHRYGQSPAEVARWSPEDLGIAIACISERHEEVKETLRAIKNNAFPVVLING